MKPRLLLDTNALITAALSPRGPSAGLIALARRREAELVMSDHLCEELATRLHRAKFRRWLSVEEVEVFVDAITVLATWFADRPVAWTRHVCDDPDDDFLVALYQDSDAHMLVSGDKAVLRIEYPGVHVYKPADALEALMSRYEWGEGLVEARGERTVLGEIDAEGNSGIIAAYCAFAHAVQHPDARDLLEHLVVPDTLWHFRKRRSLRRISRQLAVRGIATRPIYAAPEIAYIKLPPDPGVTLRAMGEVALPPSTIFATMQRCPDLVDPPGMDFDHWRVWAIGVMVEPQRIRPRPGAVP